MGVRTAVLLYINPQYAYNTKSEWVKIITRSLVYPEEPVMMKSRKLTENLPRNIILTRISLQEQRRGSRRLVRHMTCCLMLRRSRFMINMNPFFLTLFSIWAFHKTVVQKRPLFNMNKWRRNFS